jgi:hypothetical protein
MSALIGLGLWMSWSTFRLELLLGSIMTGRYVGTDTWTLGFAWHLLNGGIFALFYQAIFRTVGRAGPALGALLGVVHWMLAGVILPIFMFVRPALVGVDAGSDYFVWGAWGGMTFFGSLILHLVYGTTVGALAPPPRVARLNALRGDETETPRRAA